MQCGGPKGVRRPAGDDGWNIIRLGIREQGGRPLGAGIRPVNGGRGKTGNGGKGGREKTFTKKSQRNTGIKPFGWRLRRLPP